MVEWNFTTSYCHFPPSPPLDRNVMLPRRVARDARLRIADRVKTGRRVKPAGNLSHQRQHAGRLAGQSRAKQREILHSDFWTNFGGGSQEKSQIDNSVKFLLEYKFILFNVQLQCIMWALRHPAPPICDFIVFGFLTEISFFHRIPWHNSVFVRLCEQNWLENNNFIISVNFAILQNKLNV